MHAPHHEPRPDTAAPAWIFFDVVGTLIEPHPLVHLVYARTARRFGIPADPASVKQRFARAVRTAFATPPPAGEPPPLPGRNATSTRAADEPAWDVPREFLKWRTDETLERRRWRWIVAATLQLPRQHPALDPCFEALWRHFGRPDAWRAFEDVAPALAELDRAGYSLAAASNFDRRLHAVCHGLPALRPLRIVIASTDLGIRKPSPEFFRRIARRVAAPPGHIAYVGDDLDDDVRPAAAVGMHAVWLDRATDTAIGRATNAATEAAAPHGSGAPPAPRIRSLQQLPEHLA